MTEFSLPGGLPVQINLAGTYHVPVMLEEAMTAMSLKANGTYVDCTLGGGGYAQAILDRAPNAKLFAFETDPNAIRTATDRLRGYRDRFKIIEKNFSELKEALEELGVAEVDGIVYDLGVSSNQLDTGSIGLSYRIEAPLDMRLNPELPMTAQDIVMLYEESDLVELFFEYGEEPRSKQIARNILRARESGKIMTTTELAEIIGRGIREDKRASTLSRIFQALRIEVNDELHSLERSLESAVEMLAKGGRLVVVSYHSLEDRIVKDYFNELSAPKSEPGSEVYLKDSVDLSKASLRLVTKKPIQPTEEEVERNVRARSAKLRAAEKV